MKQSENIREIFLQNSWLRDSLATEISSAVTAERSTEAKQSLAGADRHVWK